MTLLLQECNPQTDSSPQASVWSQRNLWCHIAQQTLTDCIFTWGFCLWILSNFFFFHFFLPSHLLLHHPLFLLCRSTFPEYFCECWFLKPKLAMGPWNWSVSNLPLVCAFAFDHYLCSSQKTNGMSSISESTLEIATSSSLPPVKPSSICNRRTALCNTQTSQVW